MYDAASLQWHLGCYQIIIEKRNFDGQIAILNVKGVNFSSRQSNVLHNMEKYRAPECKKLNCLVELGLHFVNPLKYYIK